MGIHGQQGTATEVGPPLFINHAVVTCFLSLLGSTFVELLALLWNIPATLPLSLSLSLSKEAKALRHVVSLPCEMASCLRSCQCHLKNGHQCPHILRSMPPACQARLVGPAELGMPPCLLMGRCMFVLTMARRESFVIACMRVPLDWFSRRFGDGGGLLGVGHSCKRTEVPNAENGTNGSKRKQPTPWERKQHNQQGNTTTSAGTSTPVPHSTAGCWHCAQRVFCLA